MCRLWLRLRRRKGSKTGAHLADSFTLHLHPVGHHFIPLAEGTTVDVISLAAGTTVGVHTLWARTARRALCLREAEQIIRTSFSIPHNILNPSFPVPVLAL